MRAFQKRNNRGIQKETRFSSRCIYGNKVEGRKEGRRDDGEGKKGDKTKEPQGRGKGNRWDRIGKVQTAGMDEGMEEWRNGIIYQEIHVNLPPFFNSKLYMLCYVISSNAKNMFIRRYSKQRGWKGEVKKIKIIFLGKCVLCLFYFSLFRFFVTFNIIRSLKFYIVQKGFSLFSL